MGSLNNDDMDSMDFFVAVGVTRSTKVTSSYVHSKMKSGKTGE